MNNNAISISAGHLKRFIEEQGIENAMEFGKFQRQIFLAGKPPEGYITAGEIFHQASPMSGVQGAAFYNNDCQLVLRVCANYHDKCSYIDIIAPTPFECRGFQRKCRYSADLEFYRKYSESISIDYFRSELEVLISSAQRLESDNLSEGLRLDR